VEMDFGFLVGSNRVEYESKCTNQQTLIFSQVLCNSNKSVIYVGIYAYSNQHAVLWIFILIFYLYKLLTISIL
jgi:hypothetical protein